MPRLTGLDCLPGRSLVSLPQISVAIILTRYPGTFPSSPALVRPLLTFEPQATISNLFTPSTRVQDNNNVEALELGNTTKYSTVSVTVMLTLSRVLYDPFVRLFFTHQVRYRRLCSLS